MNPQNSRTVNLTLLFDRDVISFSADKKEQAEACLNLIRCGVVLKNLLGDEWKRISDIVKAEHFSSLTHTSKISIRLYLSKSKCADLYEEIMTAGNTKELLSDLFLLGVIARQRGVNNLISNFNVSVEYSNSLDLKTNKIEKGDISDDFITMLSSNGILN